MNNVYNYKLIYNVVNPLSLLTASGTIEGYMYNDILLQICLMCSSEKVINTLMYILIKN